MATGLSGFTCWFSRVETTPGLQVRIKVENDATGITGLTSTPNTGVGGYDPYFIPENRCDHFFIASSKSK
jgi:hypothetical protein